jgi:DUF4097 and DUF4098 domain-containing protein YvlB
MTSNPTLQEGTSMPTFDTPEPITATIELAVGDVRITVADHATTTVEVRPTDASDEEDRKAAERTRVEYANDELVVKAPKLRSWLSRSGGPSIEIAVELPAGSRVNASVGMGDVHADGPLGDCRIKTGLGRIALDRADTLNLKSGAGDITVDRAAGHAEVTTGSGDVRLGALDATAVIKNSNGDTWVGVAAGELRVNAANGNIAVDLAQAGVAAKSANGDVRLGEVVRGSVVLETKIGDLEVGVREGTAAWLDLNARFGHLHNALDAAEAPEPTAETVEVRGRTSVGEIVVRRP